MSKQSTSAKNIKVSNKSIKKNNAARKVPLFSRADVSTAKRGK